MSNTQQQYFNVITKGYGYVNSARQVKLEGGRSFLAVRVSLLEGSSESPRYVYMDLTVKGENAIEVITANFDAINDDNVKVLAAMDIGSLRVTPFIFQRGKNEGQPGASLKGVLIGLPTMKVNGEVVYQRPAEDDTSAADGVSEDAQEQSGVSEEVTPTVDDSPANEMVKLDPDAADFQTQKEALKQEGYQWDRSLMAWVRPVLAQAS